MTRFQRSAQIWPILVLSARSQKLISYTTVERLTGLPRKAAGLALWPIYHYCTQNQFPVLTSLVISEIDGKPKDGLGDATDDGAIFTAQARTFVFDWLGQSTPTPEHFEQAWVQRPNQDSD